jgi:hypothetical protein
MPVPITEPHLAQATNGVGSMADNGPSVGARIIAAALIGTVLFVTLSKGNTPDAKAQWDQHPGDRPATVPLKPGASHTVPSDSQIAKVWDTCQAKCQKLQIGHYPTFLVVAGLEFKGRCANIKLIKPPHSLNIGLIEGPKTAFTATYQTGGSLRICANYPKDQDTLYVWTNDPPVK